MEVHKSNRIFYYDMIRAFAIFCIVSCHVFAIYVTDVDIFGTKFWYCALFLNSLRDIGIALFVALSGCLLINKKENLTSFVKKRINRVIIPYLFWAVIFILVSFLLKHYGFVPLFKFNKINTLIFGVFSIDPIKGAVIFWFVPMILTVYIVIFLINKLNEYYKHTFKIALLVSILVIILSNFNLISLSKPHIYILYSVFAVIGYYLSNIDFSNNNKISSKHLYVIFLFIFVISYILQFSVNASTSLNLNQFFAVSQFSWINLISTISFFLFLRYLSESYDINNYNTNISKIIFSISVCSYGIYLSHIVIMHIILNFILCHVKNYLPISIFSSLTLALTFLCSWILILILSKIPYIKKISGVG